MVRQDEINKVIKEKVIQMSSKVITMHNLALEAILESDSAKALEVIKMDEYVNAYDEEINSLALESLALLSPFAKDLRAVIGAIKIANEMERIADYSKNIVELVIKRQEINKDIYPYIVEMKDIFTNMFNDAITAYDNNDADFAFEIPKQDKKINALYAKTVETLENYLKTNTDIKLVIPSFSIIRNYERAGDHTKNICEHIIYCVKGQLLELN